MSAVCNKTGACVIGEVLRGYARQWHPYANQPIFSRNINGIKLKSIGGKMSKCYVDKMIRNTKLDDETKCGYLRRAREKIQERYDEIVSIIEEKSSYIEGDTILCECEDYTANKQKVSGYSKRHSAGEVVMTGVSAFAFVDKTFSPTGTYSLS